MTRPQRMKMWRILRHAAKTRTAGRSSLGDQRSAIVSGSVEDTPYSYLLVYYISGYNVRISLDL